VHPTDGAMFDWFDLAAAAITVAAIVLAGLAAERRRGWRLSRGVRSSFANGMTRLWVSARRLPHAGA